MGSDLGTAETPVLLSTAGDKIGNVGDTREFMQGVEVACSV